ncbi:integrase core domain-containing protein (plasmid) [Acinetobacter baumannii]
MLTRTEQSHHLSTAFANLSTSITFKCQQGLFDDNHVMETILPTLLNHLYGLGLMNLNIVKHNHPAIDLGDSIMGKAVHVLKSNDIQISMDGKGRWVDNVMVERLWRSVKYEEVYLKAYSNVLDAKKQLNAYFEFYNLKRPHSSLDKMTPDEFYYDQLPQQNKVA